MASEFKTTDILNGSSRSAFEPKVPRLFGDSFSFVKTTGVRNAPEVLVLELFREIFFSPFYGDSRERQLKPDDTELRPSERAILYAARGRVKATKQSSGAGGFYAPVFPEQARVAWPRKNTDRALMQHLLRGAVSQALHRAPEEERSKISSIVVRSLLGKHRALSAADVEGKEFLSAAVANINIEPGSIPPGSQKYKAAEAATHDLADEISYVANNSDVQSLGARDPLAHRIKDDFVALCELEGALPRLLWLDFLKTFLRLAGPIWVLAQMRMTTLLRDWVIQAIETGEVDIDASGVTNAISGRWHGLLHPTTTGSSELAMHVEHYMKARVELSILYYLLRSRGNDDLQDKELTINSPGSGRVTVIELLNRFANMPVGSRADIRSSLYRSAESFGAWANPLKKGQGKNIDEFMRCLRRFEPAEEDGGFLAERYAPNQAIIFPGPGMIRLMLLLAAQAKSKDKKKGKLVLQDLENHFSEYGLEFSASAGARPRLISELSHLGLLKGSPDAGESTELVSALNVPRDGTSTGARV